MEDLATFADDIFGGFNIICQALALGGMAWALVGLQSWCKTKPPLVDKLIARSLGLVQAAATGIVIAQLARLGLKSLILGLALGHPPFPAFLHTLQFQAGCVHAAIGAILAFVAHQVRHSRLDSIMGWAALATVGLSLLVSNAWLTHAASRFEHRGQLMIVTVLHLAGAALWAGGVAQLALMWRALRGTPEASAVWPALVDRFSLLGAAAVAVLGLSGLVLAWRYIGSWQGLAGTAYGSILMAKLTLMGAALGLAALNFQSARIWRLNASAPSIHMRTPYVVQAETLLLMMTLFAAVALSGQPPASDIGAQRAGLGEVVEAFSPKWPRLRSPSQAEVEDPAVQATVQVVDENEHTAPAAAWSEFNHNVAGLFLVVIAFFALLAKTGRMRWARHWPLGFIGLGIFLGLRSDPNDWPLGHIGFWGGFLDSSTLQHRLAVLLVMALGLLEWRARTSPRPGRLPYMFPLLCAAGGILLLTHSHNESDLKSEFLVEVSHTAIGVFAVLLACGRWLELRLAGLAARWAGSGANLALFLIGIILVFYREPLL